MSTNTHALHSFQKIQVSIEERMHDSPLLSTLQLLLPEAVRLRVLAIQERSGPNSHDFQRVASLSDLLGDTPLFSSKKDHTAAHQFNALADALAVLSFFPTGVTLFGVHFQTIETQKEPDADIQ